eukprot:CAMPEP_0172316114 /NCGR_PEP_ID=MMETSP1058-20130122/27324_1 /TAXON_ID=83371 /ORGANISM="Detonula confervacea, Strain CCMP 353" /LENGTH=502 /DNA_ID=CAMNT_0013030365 /DNA_START=139 /DNA_END=1644 /DNA_ORIENTATION=+
MGSTAPDPPESPMEETIPSLRRLSTTCSHGPREDPEPTEPSLPRLSTSCTHGPPESPEPTEPSLPRLSTSHDPPESPEPTKPSHPRLSKSRIHGPSEDPEPTDPSLPRLSTSHDPPEDPEPTKRQVKKFTSSLRSSTSTTSRNRDGAIVLFEPPTATETEDEATRKDSLDVAPGAMVRVESREINVSHSRTKGQEIIVKPPPTEMRRGFDHCFVNVPCKDRLSVLFATLRRSSERKVIVICSSWESSKFHAVLFRQLEMLHVYELAENMDDVARAYDKFLYLYPGILFASDIAMREFEIPPNVDYVIQYEPPMNPTEYIYRMSNAKIYDTSCHKALLFLAPEEMHFLKCFDHIKNKELEARKVSEFQASVEKLVTKHSELNEFAWKAFRSFMLAYESHSHTDIYDRTKIDEIVVRRSFGEPHLPGYSSKYAPSNEGATESDRQHQKPQNRMGKEKSSRRKESRESDVECDDQPEKPHPWMEKEKTWRRKESKPWMTREGKTW